MAARNIRLSDKAAPAAFVRFYLVGFALFTFTPTRELFIALITPSLVLAITAVLAFHKGWNARTVAWFVFIVVSSFLLEMYGVHSGRVFGTYSYGRGLAPLVRGTPLVIGLNWLLLVYASHDAARRMLPAKAGSAGRIVAAALLMIAYDLLLEWVAPFMRMWSFGQGYPPFRNFAAWFAAAVVYQSGIEALRIRCDNRPAVFLFFCQMAFFLLAGIYSEIFIR